MHLQQQRGSGSQAELAGHRGAVRATDPDADQMTRTNADGPGIAKAVAGAGLPGQGRTLRQVGARVTIRACLATENAPDDPGRAGRQQAPLAQLIIWLQARSGRHAAAREGAVTRHQRLQARTAATEDQRQVRLGQRRQADRHTGTAQFAGKALRSVGFEQLHGRQVERGGQRLAGRHRADEAGSEVAGPVVAVVPGHVLQQRLGVDQPGIQGHAVEEGFERRTGRTQGAHHVDMTEARGVGDIHRAEVGAHGHALVLHDQDRRRGALRQTCPPAQQQILQTQLQAGIEGGVDQWRAAGTVQSPRQQGRQARLTARREKHRLLQRLIHQGLWPHLKFAQTPQHLVTRCLGAFGMAVRAQAAGRLRQHREQRGIGTRELTWWFAQVTPARRRDALEGATEGRAVQIQGEDFILGQVPLQLRRAPELLELAGQVTAMRVEQTCHLHRQRTAAGHHAPAGEVLPGRPCQRQRIHPGVLAKPAILVGQQRLQVIGRNCVRRHRITPYTVTIGEAPQRRAVLGQHHPRQIVLGQGQREQLVGEPEQGQGEQEDQQPAAS